MSLKNLTVPQAMICIALLAAVITTYKLFGEVPAGLMLAISSLINLLLGRTQDKPNVS